MTDSCSVPAPKGLKSGGRRCWKQITSAYDLRLDELILLENACRTIDRIADLDAALEGQPLMIAGSKGQEREHPLLSESRLQRTLLRQTLGQLKLPDPPAEGGAGVNRYRAAAQSRWSQHKWKWGQ